MKPNPVTNADLDAQIVELDRRQSDPAAILDDINIFLGRFIAYPSEHARVAHVLWIAHAHLMDAWESTPRIAFLSPEPASGKTRALEISELLVPRPVEAVNVSPAYLFRKVGDEDGAPTILFDEIDTVFGPRAKDNEEIRGLLNAGHRRGAVAGRCVVQGKIVKTEEIPAYCAVALAGLGDLPDTILTRSVIVRMRRRAPGEHVEAYRRRVHFGQGEVLRLRLEAWAAQECSTIGKAWPDMPEGIVDRDADVWEPLLAIADAAGGDWPERARVSAVTLVSDSRDRTPSLGVRLLEDLKFVFGDKSAMFTSDIIKALPEIDDAPWADLKGKPIGSRKLSLMLKDYGVKRKQVRVGALTNKGYSRDDLYDAWARYLPQAQKSETSETRETLAQEPQKTAVGMFPIEEGVSETDCEKETNGARKTGVVSDVSDVSDFPACSDEGSDDALCPQCGDPLDADETVDVHGGGLPPAAVHRRCVDAWVEEKAADAPRNVMCVWCGRRGPADAGPCERDDCVRKGAA